MRFSEKLQKIRKDNNITQEGLADRLNVSRQAVSKWESGTAYPDTEKLIQISKIFNVSLDELINDNVEKNNNGSKKMAIMDIVNSILDFISKSVNMFWSMKFTEKIKCLFEMCVLIGIIILVAFLSTSMIVNLFRRILIFMPYEILYGLCSLFETLLCLVWLVLGIMIVLKIFKTRYLDYYVFVIDDSVSKKTIEEPIKELKEKKEYRVVIRDPKDSSLNIVRKIGKVFSFFLKCFCFLLLIPVMICFILSIVLLVFSIFFIFEGLLFNGISIFIVGLILSIYLVLEFIYNLLFNREHMVNRIFVLFIIGLSLMGVGIGLSMVALSNFTYEVDSVRNMNIHNIKMSDDLVLNFIAYGMDNVVIDNNLSDIKLEITSYGDSEVYLYNYNDYVNKFSYKVYDISYEYNEIEMYKNIFNNLKEEKIINYNSIYDVKMYISEDNLMKLRKNVNNYNGYIVFE